MPNDIAVTSARLQQVIARHGGNPLMPFFIETLDRHLSRNGDKSMGARMVSRRLSQRALPEEFLRGLVAAYRQLPQAALDRVAAPSVRAAAESFAREFYTDSPEPPPIRRRSLTNHVQVLAEAVQSSRIGTGEVVMNPVFLLRVDPKKDSYARGEEITLHGRFFTSSGPGRVVFEFHRNGEFPVHERFEAVPSAATAQTLKVKVPSGVTFDRTYNCLVEWPSRVSEPRATNSRAVKIGPDPNKPKPPGKPLIKGIAAGRRPGEKIMIDGTKFTMPPAHIDEKDGMHLFGPGLLVELVFQDDADPSSAHHDHTLGAPAVVRLNDHQLEVQLPWRMLPGRYRVAVSQWGGLDAPGGGTSDWVTYDLLPWRFQVTADRVEVLDETDGFAGSEGGEDEVFAAWIVAVDGSHNISTMSREYDMEEDRDENMFLRSFIGADRNLLGPGDTALPVTRALAIGLYLYESNGADVKSVQEILGALSDVADAVAAVGTATANAVVAAIAKLVAVVLDLFSLIVGALEGEPTEIGRPHTSLEEHGRAWDVTKIQWGTRKEPQRSFTKTFEFDGDDEHGHYRTRVIVSRTK